MNSEDCCNQSIIDTIYMNKISKFHKSTVYKKNEQINNTKLNINIDTLNRLSVSDRTLKKSHNELLLIKSIIKSIYWLVS